MSVVVAIKDKGTIWIGADSQLTVGSRQMTSPYPTKVWKPADNNNILIGGVGSGRCISILNTATKWIDELTEKNDAVDYSYIVRTIVPIVFRELQDQGALVIKDSIKSMGAGLVFAYKDKMYMIESDGCVLGPDDIFVLGSGQPYSSGAYDMLKDDDMNPVDKISETIRSACMNNIYVSYPITIMNTKDDKIITISEESQLLTTEKL